MEDIKQDNSGLIIKRAIEVAHVHGEVILIVNNVRWFIQEFHKYVDVSTCRLDNDSIVFKEVRTIVDELRGHGYTIKPIIKLYSMNSDAIDWKNLTVNGCYRDAHVIVYDYAFTSMYEDALARVNEKYHKAYLNTQKWLSDKSTDEISKIKDAKFDAECKNIEMELMFSMFSKMYFKLENQ